VEHDLMVARALRRGDEAAIRELIEELGSIVNAGRRADLAYQIATLEQELGWYSDSLVHLAEAADLWERMGVRVWRSLALEVTASSLLNLGRVDEARSAARQADDLLAGWRDGVTVARTRQLLSGIELRAGDYRAAADILDRAEEAVEPGSSERRALEVDRAWLELATGHVAEARRRIEGLSADDERTHWASVAELAIGALSDEPELRVAEVGIRSPQGSLVVAGFRSVALTRLGRPDEAAVEITTAIATASKWEGSRLRLLDAFDSLALAWLASRDDRGPTLLAATDEWRQRLGLARYPVMQPLLDATISGEARPGNPGWDWPDLLAYALG
jgi:tetratricopeptide (TPR) repeat protein